MPAGFHTYPEGMFENSPALQGGAIKRVGHTPSCETGTGLPHYPAGAGLARSANALSDPEGFGVRQSCADLAPISRIVLLVILVISFAGARDSIGAEGQPQTAATNSMAKIGAEVVEPKSRIWQDGVGEGFLPTAETFSLEAGLGLGIRSFGSEQAHDLGLMSLTYGHMLSRVRGEGHWYRGNWEARLELFGGMQFHPDVDTDGWFVGLTPHLRYNFATGSRWIPFLDAGAGVSATGIGPPDLSGTFEFNLQGTAGTHWFVRDNLALTGEVRYMHMSCAGIHSPNLGMNDVLFMLGVTWFFGKK